MKPRGLGKGLGSLIPNKLQEADTLAPLIDPVTQEPRGTAHEVSIDAIDANPYQPRHQFDDSHLEDLVQSIKEHGILQPLVVSLIPGKDNLYELIAGERRLRAAKKAGLTQVPIIVREVNDKQKLELAIIENIQRQNLNPIEEALAYRQLMDEYDMTQEDVSLKLGKNRSVVANTLRLLKLPDEIQDALRDGLLTAGHARAILSLETTEQQMDLFNKIRTIGMTVREAEHAVKKVVVQKHTRSIVHDPFLKEKETELRDFLGTKVSIQKKKKGGQISIDFYSEEELPSLIRRITGEEML